MLVNLNIRRLGNGAILVQYQRDGKAFDAGFVGWAEFIAWLAHRVSGEPGVLDDISNIEKHKQ